MRRARAALAACLLACVTALAAAGALEGSATAGPATKPAAPAGARLSLVLPLVADDAALRRFALAVSTPGSPQYGRYAGIPELARRFGARPAAAAAVVRYLRASGARAVALSATRMYVTASMTVAQAQRTFATRLSSLRAASGERFMAPFARATASAGPARVPRALRGLATGVVGLDTQTVVPRSQLEHAPSARAAAGQPSSAYMPRTGRANGCASAQRTQGFTPGQYTAAYGLDHLHAIGLRGGGERIALIEIDGFKRSDISAFAGCFRLHVPPIHVTTVGFSRPLAPGGETTLDLEVLTTAAPRAVSLDVYENKGNASQVLQAFTAPLIAPGAKPDVISASLGICEPFTYLTMGASGIQTIERDLELAAATGITVLAAAGDNGSSACQLSDGSIVPKVAASYPASSSFATAVGGTNVRLDGANHITAEVVWNDAALHTAAGGGGVSGLFGRPAYQTGVVPVNAREVPDVSLLADLAPGYAIFCSAADQDACGGWTSVGGTSAASPLLAGGLALIDQDLRRRHRRFLGLINPLLYRLARSHAGPGIFRDVTQIGNDLGPYLPEGGKALGCCNAAPGFDAASGWGSVNLTALDRAAQGALPYAPGVTLTVPPRQRPLAAGGLVARLRCSGPCRVYVTGEIVLSSKKGIGVRSVHRRLGRAGSVQIRLGLTRAQAQQIRAALAARHAVYAELFGVAIDAQGHPLTVTAAVAVPIRG